jgi:hypothetical protein
MTAAPQPHKDKRINLAVGLFATVLGAFLLLIALGFVLPDTKMQDAERWAGGAAGAAFLFAGIVVILQTLAARPDTPEGELPPGTPMWIHVLNLVLILAIVAVLAGIATWVAFAPGERAFSGFMWFMPQRLGELAGRVVFGLAAVLTWFILLVIAVVGIKRLRTEK